MLDTINLNSNAHDHSHAPNRFAVIPTAEKLNANRHYTGRGVRVAFLDSGFYPHADFAERVVAFHDVSGEEKSCHSTIEPRGVHWHGTQTVTACAGNGALSEGVYRGLAHEAELVLVKASENGSVREHDIERGLRWILENREKYGIRVLNISLGGDRDAPNRESRINQLVEKLIEAGLVVTVAAGNSSASRSIPPASCPSAVTVGGFSDGNRFAETEFELYHSNFGATTDGILKPEIIAPAMFVAAPILPETEFYKQAETLSMLAAAPDYAFRWLLEECWREAGLPEDVVFYNEPAARRFIEEKLSGQKVVATHYQHVDGTSFAAPIAASVVAQMLEANPNLTPAAVKNILISTARKLPHAPSVRQGFGILNASLAVAEAAREPHFLDGNNYRPPRVEGHKIKFFYHDDAAAAVSLAGDFNDWRAGEILFRKCNDGVWVAEIGCLPSGRYRYKFCINDDRWTEDASHGLKEADDFGGFNSILIIE